MISAFGVDHGYDEIEKISASGLFKPVGQAIGQQARAGAKRVGGMAGKNISAGNARLGGAQKQLGRGLKKVSTFAMNRPGLTGGLAVGGGVAGVGGTGAAIGNRRRY